MTTTMKTMMYMIPAREPVKSLKWLSQKALLAVVTDSNCKNEDDIETARTYLNDLPLTLRLQLAKNVQKHLHDWHCVDDIQDARRIYVRAQQWPKFALWRVGCFLPGARDMPVELVHTAFDDHYSAKTLKYLSSDECSISKFRNTCLIFSAGFPHEQYPLPSLSYKMHFKMMLSRFTDLTEVDLGTKCGDSCLQAIGERCKKLRNLTLSSDCDVTNDGFVMFAKSQRGNCCLDGIFLRCNRLRVSLLGLSQVWLLPLSIKTLYCHSAQFDYTTDGAIPLECPNGPTQLTDLTVRWHIMTDSQESSVRKVLGCTEVLFPALQRMKWEDPPHDMVTSGNVWETVKSLNQTSYSAINLQELADCFPKIVSLSLKNTTHFDYLRHGSFKYLQEFIYCRGLGQGCLPFDGFSSIVSEARSLRAILVGLSPEVANEYSDVSLCKLFRHCNHLKNLRVLNLFTTSYNRKEKIPLTEAFVSCVLQTCENIQLLGDLGDWVVDLGVIRRNKIYDIADWKAREVRTVLAKFNM